MVEYNKDTFRNISFGANGQTEWPNWTATVGIFIDTSASNSDLSHNIFQNLSSQILYQSSDKNLGVSGIFGYGFSNTTMNNNTFDTVNEGIKIFFDYADGKNVHINNNTFTNVHRMAIEMQHWSSAGLEVAYNNISKPLAPWKLTFGISAALGGTNTTIHDNIVDDQLPSVCGAGCWVGMGSKPGQRHQGHEQYSEGLLGGRHCRWGIHQSSWSKIMSYADQIWEAYS